MASRRIRIKGITHIPPRKKKENNLLSLDSSNGDSVSPKNECNLLKEEEHTDVLTHHTSLNSNDVASESLKELPCTTPNKLEKSTEKLIINSNVNCFEGPGEVIQFSNFPKLNGTEVTDDSIFKNEPLSAETSSNKLSIEVPQIKELENHNPKNNAPRRKFLKPGINLNAVKKRPATKDLSNIGNSVSSGDVHKKEISDRSEENVTFKPSEKVIVINEIRIPKFENKSVPFVSDLSKIISVESNGSISNQGLYSEVTLNETHLGVNEGAVLKNQVVTFSPNIKKVVPEIHNASDSEYPPPPASPSKINRSRIKAIPRLSQRKTSCSASESEDETRKYGRIRNNSVCSVVSTSCLEPPTPTSEIVPPKEVTPNLPKKLNRTEQSRKLAEARREFHKRFGSNSPDKQRLKMIDLIFYNPTANPMSKKTTKPDNDVTTIEKDSEENVDDPSKVTLVEDKEKENDAENGMPVPQIKIGPSGEIILDEQSLIVENAEVARQKEQMQNSQVVNGDFDTGYGIYKRVRRALAWTQKETIRFYKAINLIGTDFTVMTQFFPKRTRRELKMKFKKEEKVNRQLIDKAIMQPCNYNFSELKREIEIEEEEEAALQKLKEEDMEKMKQAQLAKLIKKDMKRKDREAEANKILSNVVNSTQTENTTQDTDENKIILPPKKRLKGLDNPVKIKPQSRKIKSKPLTIKSVLDDSDADISDMETQSESEEEETIPFLKPTRSGRMPKSTERYTTIVDPVPKQYCYEKKKVTADEVSVGTTQNESQQNTAIRNRRSSSLESNSDKLLPGSVVIMMEEDPVTGISEYKVFMVTPEKKLEPLNLPSEIVAKLIKERTEEDNAEFLVPSVPEKNVTIPATEEKGPLTTQEAQDIVFVNCPDSEIPTNVSH